MRIQVLPQTHKAAIITAASRSDIMKKTATNCESCANYIYDEECDCYCCEINLDEDEYARFLTSQTANCPYYDFYDEYKIVRKQN